MVKRKRNRSRGEYPVGTSRTRRAQQAAGTSRGLRSRTAFARRRRGNAAIEAVMIMVFLLGAFAFLGWAVYWMYRESFLIILSWQHLPY